MNRQSVTPTMVRPSNRAKPLSHGPVPLLDVARANNPLREEILQAIARVSDSGRFVMGPDCQSLEKSLAELTGASHGIGCASGSDALLLALMAIGVGPGDEVIMPSFTFFATASAVTRLGGRPVFVDIEPLTFNIDPAQIEGAITPSTKAIIPVHLFGQCARMDPICEIARRHKLMVVEDAAQAIGARYHNRAAGSLGDVACFSFYPTKNLGGFGDGGMLTTSNDALAERLRLLRGHGMQPRYYHQVVGINSRLDSIQAAVLNVKLPHLATWAAGRQENAARYHQLFVDAQLERVLGLPEQQAAQQHAWNQYTIRASQGQRDALREHLTAAKIGTEIYYPVPLHQQECFRDLNPDHKKDDLPETERAAEQVLSLPIFPGLFATEQQVVVARIADFFKD